MMDDLIAFIKARLDEDEAAAKPFEGTTWQAEPSPIGVILVDGEPLIEGHVTGLTAHIARHDPDRVLREVAAKRAILAEHLRVGGSCRMCIEWPTQPWPCRTVRILAAVHSDHPDYRAEWKPGA
jgi:uncharacterized protein DUF6221